MTHPGLGPFEYARYSDLLGLPPRDLRPLERAAALPPWMTAELCATEAAQDRLRAWSARLGLAEPDNEDTRASIIERVSIVGDDLLSPLVKRALQRIPPPVLDHLRRHAVILVVGRSCGGWTQNEPPPAADALEGRRLLVCGYTGRGSRRASVLASLRRLLRRQRVEVDADTAFLGIVAHETCHHWLLPPATKNPVPPTELEILEADDNRRRFLTCAREWGLMSKVTGPRVRDEDQACDLAESWGFVQDSEGCALNARRKIYAEAATMRR